MKSTETAVSHRPPRREADRAQLATLLELELDTLSDDTRLHDELALDSLAMMRLLTWMEERGVEAAPEQARPATIGEVLTLLDKAAARRMSVKITRDGQTIDIGPPPQPPAPAADPLTPQLTTKTFRLMPILPDDIGYLYGLATQPETCFRWRYRGAPPAPDRFAADLWSQVLVQFTVRTLKTNDLVGLVVAYNAGPATRYVCVGAVFPPQIVGSGTAAQATALFIKYLFHTFSLEKVYLEVPGFNWPQVQSGEGRLFTVEGILHNHDSYAGRSWDHRICAIYSNRQPRQQTTQATP